MILVGIDPGKSGGICIQQFTNAEKLGMTETLLCKMPETEGDILKLVSNEIYSTAMLTNDVPSVYLEKVGGYIGSPQAGSRMFVFGENYGFIKGVCMTLGFKLNLVTPQKWQKAFGLGTRSGSTTKEWKNKLRAEAQRLYPNLDVPLQVADALLILEYGRRCENGIAN